MVRKRSKRWVTRRSSVDSHDELFQPVPLDVEASKGINGCVLPDPDCIPGSTYYSPLIEEGQPDIRHDRSLSAIYLFPKQLSPHRSILLPGVRRPPRILAPEDLRGSWGRPRGGGGGGRGGYNNHDYGGHASTFASPMHHSPPTSSFSNGRGRFSNDYAHGPPSYSSRPPPQHQYREGYASGGPRSYPPQSAYSGNSYSNGRGGHPSRAMSGPYGRGGYHTGPPSRGSYGRGGSRGGYHGGGGGGGGSGGGHDYGNSGGGGGFGQPLTYSGGYNSNVYDGGYSSGRGGPPRGRGRGRGGY